MDGENRKIGATRVPEIADINTDTNGRGTS
jgi:hypothetical protein